MRKEKRKVVDINSEVTEVASIVRIAKIVIQRALVLGAKAIVITPTTDTMVVETTRCGGKDKMMELPKYVHAPLVSRFKTMANMDPTERSSSQDGCFSVSFRSEQHQLTVLTAPTELGENVTIKIKTA